MGFRWLNLISFPVQDPRITVLHYFVSIKQNDNNDNNKSNNKMMIIMVIMWDYYHSKTTNLIFWKISYQYKKEKNPIKLIQETFLLKEVLFFSLPYLFLDSKFCTCNNLVNKLMYKTSVATKQYIFTQNLNDTTFLSWYV